MTSFFCLLFGHKYRWRTNLKKWGGSKRICLRCKKVLMFVPSMFDKWDYEHLELRVDE